VSRRPDRDAGTLADGGNNFEPLAVDYDRLRPADDNWLELVDVMWADGDLAGRRVLDVGCGTGRIARALADRGARVWGVDPSPAMLEQSRARCGRSVGLKSGSVEALPFRAVSFERLVLHLVVHLVERERAFAESARVLCPGGRIVIATFAPSHFDGIWLARYFPSLPGIDRARFATPDELAVELETAGFANTRQRDVVQEARVEREDALERLRGRFISTLWLLPEDEYRAGVERAERELPAETAYPRVWTVVVAERG
jgi:ubiquinone/menaquinone biosynthesis C-methylase UbiE